MAEAARGAARPVMLYDGTCGFCTRVAELALARLPDRVDWAPFQTVDLGAYGLSTAEAAASVRLVETSGRILHGGAAFARLLVASGPPWSVPGRLLLVPPLSLLAEGVYRVVAAFRRRLPGVTPALARRPEDRPGARPG